MNKSHYEVINQNITKDDLNNNYFHFMKYAYKYENVNRYEDGENRLRVAYKHSDNRYNREKLEKDFPFFTEEVHEKIKINVKYTNYPLEYYKVNKTFDNFYIIKEQIIKDLEFISNILVNEDEEKIKNYVNSLIPGSFIILQEFELISPYFSKDDDEFYIIDNPILKEKVYKVPMIRGSMWKGCLLDAASELLKETIEENSSEIEQIIKRYAQIYRIFGTGSEKFRTLKDVLDRYIKSKIENGDEYFSVPNLEKRLLEYALFELGISLSIKCGEKELLNRLIELIDEKIKSGNFDNITVRKGRAIFYPTYFDRITLEVINPHNRKTKAGTSPIYFEVVPKETKGYLQIIYIPFDSVLLSEREIKEQTEKDIDFMEKIIKKALAENGIGAKTKLGWGRANLIPEKTRIYRNVGGYSSEQP